MARAYSIIFIIPRSAQKDEFSSSERERETIFPLDIKIAWLLNAVFFCSLLFRVRLWGSLKSRSTRRTDAAAPSAVVYIYLLREVHAISDFVESHKTSASSSRKEKEKELCGRCRWCEEWEIWSPDTLAANCKWRIMQRYYSSSILLTFYTHQLTTYIFI